MNNPRLDDKPAVVVTPQAPAKPAHQPGKSFAAAGSSTAAALAEVEVETETDDISGAELPG